MRPLKVTFRKEARADLENLYLSVLELSQNKITAFRFYQRIHARCQRIGFVPHGGRPRDDLEEGLRMVPFEHSAVILYRVEPDRVRITNIFYRGRDYETLYRGISDSVEEPESHE
jgi:toxin ParE1/3/4